MELTVHKSPFATYIEGQGFIESVLKAGQASCRNYSVHHMHVCIVSAPGLRLRLC